MDILKLAEKKVRKPTNEYEKIIVDSIANKNAIINTQSQYEYVIYSSTPLQLSNALANTLSEHTKYVILRTKLYYKEYEINIKNEVSINIILFIPMYAEIEYKMSTNILNSIMLKDLYNINNFYEMSSKPILQSLLQKTKEVNIHGGNKNSLMTDVYKKVTTYDILLLTHMEITDEYVFEVPINIIYKNEEDYVNILNYCVDTCKKNNYEVKIIKHNNFYIPNDFRLKKTTLFVISKESFYLMNLYNSGTYELIPIVKPMKPLRIVALRFMFLDMYFLENIKPAYLKLSKQILRLIVQAIEECGINVIWYGYYKDENYEKIKINGKHKCFPYYPYEYKLLHEKFREL